MSKTTHAPHILGIRFRSSSSHVWLKPFQVSLTADLMGLRPGPIQKGLRKSLNKCNAYKAQTSLGFIHQNSAQRLTKLPAQFLTYLSLSLSIYIYMGLGEFNCRWFRWNYPKITIKLWGSWHMLQNYWECISWNNFMWLFS